MTFIEACPRVESLSALVDGETDRVQRTALDAHLAQCPVCRSTLAELQQLRDSFAALPAPTVEFDLAPDIDRLIQSATRGGSRISRQGSGTPYRWRWAFIAPGGLAAVGLGLWLGASVVPALGTAQRAGAAAAQMAAFSTAPPGSICLTAASCGRTGR